ncbi:GIY-YIG nuclease family protein [Rhodobacter sp. NSM]|uniref:GIY-YIG nuclease family protein n=1 Tax=Rhodobacter sp. NSM TaxID=3457501 RepID=UPI003FCF5545
MRDRGHVALECQTCGAQSVVNRIVLMDHQPLCAACLKERWTGPAEAAGLTFLRRDKTDRAYGYYRAPCGHEVRRQREMIVRMARGETGLRCETCHAAKEAAEAERRGWQLVGPDPQGNPNYRFYRHEACGHEQRVARANMGSGRFGCGGCGLAWPAAPNNLYVLRFGLPDGVVAVKLGHSNNVESRLNDQLRLRRDLPAQILCTLPMPSGVAALRAEKRLHATLRRRCPQAVLPKERFAGVINVKTEVYDGALEPILLAALEAVEAGMRRRRSRRRGG